MSRIVIFCIVGILVLSGLGAVSISGEEIKEDYITLKFSDISIEVKDGHTTLELNGADSDFVMEGHYIVPSKIETFYFPFKTEIIDVSCNVKNTNQNELNKELMVTPEPVLTDMINSDIKINSNENPIAIDNWYDYDIGTGIVEGELKTIVKVQVFPVQYDDTDNSISWAEDIKIKIDYKEPESTFKSTEDTYNFVIITPSEYEGRFTDYIAHKESRGISTKLVTLSDIYNGNFFPVNGRDNPEKIKYFIKDAIENWETAYVLLVGGYDEFPNRETHIFVDYGGGDDEVFVTDLYYADIYDGQAGFASWDTNENDIFGEFDWGNNNLYDDVDLYPDVYLSRIAVINGGQVDTSLDKFINYETSEAYKQSWFSNIVVIGGDTSPNDEEDVDEGEYTNQAVLDIMDGFIPDKIWYSNGRLGGISPSGVSNINNGIDNGCGFLDWAGHGAPEVWTTYPHNGDYQTLPTPTRRYRNTHISSLTNGDMLPIVITGACSPSKYMAHDNCFSWSYISNSNGGGIGSFGPNSLSWGYTTSYCIEGLGGKMHLELYQAYKEEGAFTFGEMWAKAIENYIYASMDGGDHKTIQQWQPFGDPTLVIGEESQPPNKPSRPDGPIQGDAGESYTYSTSTTDPEGDQVAYLFDWDDGTYSEWTDYKSSGTQVSVSHTYSSSGDYGIKVKAKDSHGVFSEWSDPLSVSMPRIREYQFPIIEKLLELFPIFRNLLIG